MQKHIEMHIKFLYFWIHIARGTAGVDSVSTGGTFDISNADRLGKSETQLVNIFIEGVAQIIKWEQALEEGSDIEGEVANAGLPAKY